MVTRAHDEKWRRRRERRRVVGTHEGVDYWHMLRGGRGGAVGQSTCEIERRRWSGGSVAGWLKAKPLGFGIQSFGLRIWRLGFWGIGFRLQGLGFKV